MKQWLLCLFVFQTGLSASLYAQNKLAEPKIAFISDVHFADLYGQLSGTDFQGVKNPIDGRNTLLRTMSSQLQSTRIFNENYFAFIAALEDVAKRGVRLVALPGDYSDDGQPVHLKGLQKILKEYHQKYGIQFFITTGNHDPVGPFAKDAGKKDFLGEKGMSQPIFSKAGVYNPTNKNEHPTAISPDISELGYEGVMDHLSEFGFFAQPHYLYWASPFSSYSPDNYSYRKAREASQLHNRMYTVAPGDTIPDATYLVEPVDGLWLLAIDGNVYLPAREGKAKTFSSAEAGYNNVILHKRHILSWLKTISEMAKQRGKTLIAFSHYPMVDYNDSASPEIAELLGPDKWQLKRLPGLNVAREFAKAGINIHFGGHMHINDTGVFFDNSRNSLVNIQTPSLAAYIPAYKLLTLKEQGKAEIETITISEVKGFDKLFPLYRTEYEFLSKNSSGAIWDSKILNSKTYYDFTRNHLEELVRLRFLPQDWPEDLRNFLPKASGQDLLLLLSSGLKSSESIASENNKQDLLNRLKANKLQMSDFAKWTGIDLINDFYRLRSADQLALKDIGVQRLRQYQVLAGLAASLPESQLATEKNKKSLVLFFSIFNKFLKDSPADHFLIDLSTGDIRELPSK
ncbi:metallophosphoesterase family protein [Desertivirga brevis]|uniref:metallophosphoesterase family protein n=1 Tax=Desertivirga brevis TaxID=2810310 RepID=UPI001A97047C|nr:metallophosphoesterase [Pedobacter sp. SYSU D00873]